MTTEVQKHLRIALKEVGEIKPRFDPVYPIEYAGESPEVVGNGAGRRT